MHVNVAQLRPGDVHLGALTGVQRKADSSQLRVAAQVRLCELSKGWSDGIIARSLIKQLRVLLCLRLAQALAQDI